MTIFEFEQMSSKSFKIIKRLVVALAFVVYCKCSDVNSYNCSLSQWIVQGRPGKAYFCLDCSSCPPGQELSPVCTTTIPHGATTQCQACTKGETYSTELDIGSCKPCNICGKNRDVLQACEPNRNTVCGECSPGYYETVAGDCELCQQCCSNSQDSDKNDKCVRDGEKHCTADSSCPPIQEEELHELPNNVTHKNGTISTEKKGHSKDDSKVTIIYAAVGGTVLFLVVLVLVIGLYHVCNRHEKLHGFKIVSITPPCDDIHGSAISVTANPVQVQQDDHAESFPVVADGSAFTKSFYDCRHCIVNLPERAEAMCDTSESSSSKTSSRITVSSIFETTSGSSSRSATSPLGPDVGCSYGDDQEPLSIEESREGDEKRKE